VALNARVAAQQKDLRALTAINASLTSELEALRAQRARPAEAPYENGARAACCRMPPTLKPSTSTPASQQPCCVADATHARPKVCGAGTRICLHWCLHTSAPAVQ
jgi:hypothetical protein